MKNLTVNDYLKLSLGLSAVVIALSCAYYFAYYTPKLNQEKITKEQQQADAQLQLQKDQQTQQRVSLSYCLHVADINATAYWNRACKDFGVNKKTDDCNLPKYNADAVNTAHQQERDDCFKQYPQK